MQVAESFWKWRALPSGVAVLLLAVGLTACLSTDTGSGGLENRMNTPVTIDVSKTREPISKYIYGQFIEHLGRCIYGGIWAEMLEDRKFYYPIKHGAEPWNVVTPDKMHWAGDGVPYEVMTGSPWIVIGDADTVRMIDEDPFVGEHTPEVRLSDDGTPRGIYQERLGLVEGREYVGRVILSGSPGAGPIEVSLTWDAEGDGRQTVRIPQLSEEFVTTPFRFTAGASTDNGRLEIVGLGTGAFRVGTVSLMPADNVQGLRADTLALLRELDSPVYRWPGGNFVSGYDWKDGVGDRDRRPPRKNPAWKGVEHNDFGLHEFMAFCRELNTEPYIAVNTGLGDAEGAAAEVEYVNGAADTPMGKWRSENGHAEPFEVKWWGVGNEMYGDWQLGHMPLAEYVKKHKLVVEAMRRVDPSIQLVAVGLVGEWSETMLSEGADHMALISEHFYCQEKEEVEPHVFQIARQVRRITREHRGYRKKLDALEGKDIRIAMDEWNYWYGAFHYGEIGVRYYLKDALGVARGLHEFYRNSDLVFMANYAQTVNVIGCIKTTKTDAAFAATGLPLKLYRNHFGVVPVSVGNAPESLDIEAALSEKGDVLTISIVNPTEKAAEVDFGVRGRVLEGTGTVWRITGDDAMAYNEPGKAPNVVIEEDALAETPATLMAPAMSATLYALKLFQ